MIPMIKLANFQSVTLATKTWTCQRNSGPYTYHPWSAICAYMKISVLEVYNRGIVVLGGIQQRNSGFVCSTCVEPGSGDIYHNAECSTKYLQCSGSQPSWQVWLCTLLGHQKCSINHGLREHPLAHLCSAFQTLEHVIHSALCSTSASAFKF